MKSDLGKKLPPLEVANAIIAIAYEANSPVSHLKLQKLVYYAHGWWLALTDEPLINESIAAWRYGPVVESLYHVFKHFGAAPIYATEPSVTPEGEIHIPLISKDDTTRWSFLKKIWEIYGRYDAVALSSMTHKEGTPWQETMNKYGPSGGPIDDELIKKYFKDVAARGKKDQTA